MPPRKPVPPTRLHTPRHRGTVVGMSATVTNEPLVNTHFRIAERQKESLRELSFKLRVPESEIVRDALESHLPKLAKKNGAKG